MGYELVHMVSGDELERIIVYTNELLWPGCAADISRQFLDERNRFVIRRDNIDQLLIGSSPEVAAIRIPGLMETHAVVTHNKNSGEYRLCARSFAAMYKYDMWHNDFPMRDDMPQLLNPGDVVQFSKDVVCTVKVDTCRNLLLQRAEQYLPFDPL